MRRLPQSTTYRVTFKAFLATDHSSVATGKTIAVTLSKNGGAFGNPSAGATNATEIANGWYYVDLSTTDTGTLGDLVIRGAETTIDPAEQIAQVVSATTGGLTALPSVVAGANGGLPLGDASGRVTVVSIANGAIAAATFAANALDAVWSTATRLLTAGTNIVLAKGTGVTGLNDLDAAAIRSATGLASANLDTQLSAINTNVNLVGSYVDTEIGTLQTTATAIKNKTDNLPSDPADASDIAGAFTALQSHGDATWTGTDAVTVTKIDELHQLHGLKSGSAMTVTPTSRTVGTIAQTISGDGTTTSTVTRTA